MTDGSDTILLAVTGMSPAILTETVWALATNEGIVPQEVRVITTSAGWATVQRELLDAPPGGGQPIWNELSAALADQGFAVENALWLREFIIQRSNKKTKRKEKLNDIRDADDNADAADFLIEQVRNAVAIETGQVIASIAGGRKTMGALLYACMTLLGRPTDRLTHVLVSEPYESPLEPRFYFPKQTRQRLATRDGSTYEAFNAQIQLADVPFVALRNLFERDLIKKPSTYTQLVSLCREKITDIRRRECTIQIRSDAPVIIVNGIEVNLPANQYVFMRWLAERAGQPAIDYAPAAADQIRPLAEKLYSQRDKNTSDWRAQIKPASINDRWVTRTNSELKAKLAAAGPEAGCLVPLLPTGKRISLDLDPSRVTIVSATGHRPNSKTRQIALSDPSERAPGHER